MKLRGGIHMGDAAHICLAMARTNFVRLLVTLIILSLCASGLGVCLTTIVPDYNSRQEEIFLNNVRQNRYIGFSRYYLGDQPLLTEPSLFSQTEILGSVSGSSPATLSGEEISYIEGQTGLPYAYVYAAGGSALPELSSDGTVVYRTPNHALLFGEIDNVEWYYGDFDRYEEAEYENEALLRGEDSHYSNIYTQSHHADEAQQKHFISAAEQRYNTGDGYAYLPEERLNAFGMRLLAGRMPRSGNEIAICECELYEFMRRGYYLYEDAASGNYVAWKTNLPSSPWYNPRYPVGYIMNLDEIPKKNAEDIVPVRSAEDMIGKGVTISAYVEDSGRTGIFATIVGVVDTGCSYQMYERRNAVPTLRATYTYLEDKIFISPDIIETLHLGVSAMLAPRPTDRNTVSKCLTVLQRTFDEAKRHREAGQGRLTYAVIIADESEFVSYFERINTFFPQLLFIASLGSAILLSFGIFLTYFLISTSAAKHRKEMGILKAMGARDRDIYLIFLLFAAMIGVALYAVSLPAVCGILYGLLGITVGGVRLLQFGALQAVLLFLFCIGAPILSMLFPVRKFLKRSCVEMIRDTPTERKCACLK